jgi:hypothetical protein
VRVWWIGGIVALVACGRGGLVQLDPSLSDGDAPARRPPVEALAAFADATSPSLRGESLAALVREARDVEALAAWALRGLWDPDPLVVLHVADALAARGDGTAPWLAEVVARPSADPVVRAELALRLRALGQPDTLPAGAWRALPAGERVPVALAAAVAGDADARDALLADAGRGAVPDDVGLWLRLGRSGIPGLAEALAAARTSHEEVASPRADAARVLLGDPAARSDWATHAASRDGFSPREALDVVVAANAGERAELLAATRSVNGSVRAAFAVLADGPDGLRRAAGSASAEARRAAVRLAGEAPESDAAALAARLAADPEPAVRAEVARLVARRRLPVPVEAVRAWLDDDRPEVRVAGYAAALALEGPSAPQTLAPPEVP